MCSRHTNNASLANRSPDSNPCLHKPIKSPIEFLASNWHLHGVERIFHDKVRVKFVYPPHQAIDIWLLWLCEEQEFGASDRLEALQAEIRRFEHFNARGAAL